MRIWIYSGTPAEAQRLSRSITAPDTVAGTPALYAAICGEVDLLLSSKPLKNTMCELFASYNVSVKSASSLSSKSS